MTQLGSNGCLAGILNSHFCCDLDPEKQNKNQMIRMKDLELLTDSIKQNIRTQVLYSEVYRLEGEKGPDSFL